MLKPMRPAGRNRPGMTRISVASDTTPPANAVTARNGRTSAGPAQIDTAASSLTSPPPVRRSAKKTNPSAKTIVPQAMPPAQSTSAGADSAYNGYSAAIATQT